MNRFGFIIHPLEVADVARKYKFARFFPDRLVESLVRRVRPKVVGVMRGIRSEHDGSEVEGLFIGCPLTTRVMLEEPAESTVPPIIEAARVAAAEGAGIVGLGAMTSVVGDAGVTVNQAVDIAVTTGNTYTVATALEGTRHGAALMGLDLDTCHLAIVGATGSIGRAAALLMADDVGRLTLVQRDRERGERLAAELRQGRSTPIDVAGDVATALPRADVVICVSSSREALILPEHLKPGAVVCDVARPRDVSISVGRERDDVLVIEGGVVRPPGTQVDLGFNFGFPAGLMYACMAETSLLAMAGRCEPFSLGRELQPERVREIGELAALHGYRLAGLRSFERALTDEQIETIRRCADLRRQHTAAA